MGRSEWYRGEKESPGCMSGMLHYLDFHHLLFAAGNVSRAPPDSSPRVASYTKGVEAPRNSLELDEGKSSAAAEFYDVPFELGIQLTTNKKMVVFEEERRSTQAETPRTPSLVARLMGLDGLPDQAMSPATTGYHTPVMVEEEKKKKKKKKKKAIVSEECKKASPTQPQRQPLRILNCNSPPALPQIRLDAGSRSLPDTPRASSVRPWEFEPRLSLHMNNKENMNNLCEDLSSPGSPSLYTAKPRKMKDLGRQQLDENKSPRSHHYAREIVKQVKESVTNRRAAANGDQNGIRSKRTRPPMKSVVCAADDKLRTQPKNNLENDLVIVKPSRPPPPPPVAIRDQVGVKAAKCTKRDSCERFPSAQRSEAPPRDLIKRGTSSSGTTTSRCAQKSSHVPQEQDPEYRYVSSILSRGRCTGSRIDPIVFHQLELELPFNLLGPLRHRWNRRLLFHLVQEILDDLHDERRRRLAGGWRDSPAPPSVLKEVWEGIRRLPAADCRVLGDIDALVAGDLAEANVRRVLRHPAVAGEAEGVVAEVGEAIVDDLLGDAAAALLTLTSRRIQITETALGNQGAGVDAHVSCRGSSGACFVDRL
ncbi:uncharacterized protein [Typha angustifolia]|uniref:uncharacterized protein n=1 Tax=Typha angustifolia TaxID=59011 RepID=UPI003C2AEB81